MTESPDVFWGDELWNSPEVLPEEILACFIHSNETDGIKMIEPIAISSFFNILQIVCRIRI